MRWSWAPRLCRVVTLNHMPLWHHMTSYSFLFSSTFNPSFNYILFLIDRVDVSAVYYAPWPAHVWRIRHSFRLDAATYWIHFPCSIHNETYTLCLAFHHFPHHHHDCCPSETQCWSCACSTVWSPGWCKSVRYWRLWRDHECRRQGCQNPVLMPTR